MPIRTRLVLPLVLLALVASTARASSDLDTLVDWMTGSFASTEQAEKDSSFFDIRLEMVRIWPEREDGIYLYVEQAVATALERPYRQRIYRVREEDGEFRSEVFTFEEPLRFAGAWRTPDRFAELDPDDLALREGCAVILTRTETGFEGATGSACVSSLRGASTATSEVVLTEDVLTSWDRGFDAEGEQVWGSTEGPYVFRRVR